MNRNVLAVLLAALALAGADSGEFLVDPDVAYTTAESYQLSPAAASNGVNSLIVWSDERSGDWDIYGARLVEQFARGKVLDEASIAISTSENAQTNAAVGSDGTGYLVAWADQREDTSDIYACRVTSEGLVLDPDGIPVSTASGFQGEPAVTFDGTNYLVVWTDGRGDDFDLYGARVTPAGTVVDTSGLPLVAIPAYQASPAVVYDGTNVLLVWEDTRIDGLGDIYAARVTSDGVLLDSVGFPVSAANNSQSEPGLACDGDEVLVVWHDMRSGTDTDIFGARVTKSGEVLDTAGIAIASAPNFQWHPRVAYDETNYLVVWKEQAAHGDIFGARVASDGSVLDPQGFPVPGGEYESDPVVTFNGTNNAVAWYDLRHPATGYNIYATRVNADGVVLDPGSIAVSVAAGSQKRPAAAFDGAEFLVVWEETRDMSRDIRGVRIAPGGTVLDSTAIRIPPSGGEQSYPSVAYGMQDFLVVWEEGRLRDRDVRGARVSPTGAVLDSTGLLISDAPWEQVVPVAASDGADYLVVWQDWRNADYDIYCARVSHAGTLLDTAGIAVCTLAGNQLRPAVASNGSEYLVLWQDAGSRNLHGARVSSQGVVLDPDGFVVSTAPGVQEQPGAAADGENFLVVWPDLRNVDRDIYGTRVAGTGTVLDPAGIRICSAPGLQSSVAVEHDGTNFLVVWTDQRTGEQDIYGARVTPQGAVLDTFAVTTQQGDQVDPALAHGGGAKMLLAYSVWTEVVDGEPYNSPRVWGTLSPVIGLGGQPTELTRTPEHMPTLIRGILVLGAADVRQSTECRAELLDVSGRKALDLRPGANDVRTQAPGVYFVRNVQAQAQAIRKVVITR